MLSLYLIAVGGLSEGYLREACSEYSKRLSRFIKLNLIEIPEARIPSDPSPAEISKALAEEGERIRGKIPERALVFSLCVEGKMISSEELAEILEAATAGTSRIAVIIGGSHGLSPEIKSLSQRKISMSKMTFPHQIARLLILEQLYRACKINSGEAYHK